MLFIQSGTNFDIKTFYSGFDLFSSIKIRLLTSELLFITFVN